MDDLAASVTGWEPEPCERTGVVGGWPSAAFAALLDQPPPGDVLPPLWHWFHLLDHPAQAELGADGHPTHGRFLPPIPHRRRMFAGGRLQVPGDEGRVSIDRAPAREERSERGIDHRLGPLRIGDEVTRRSSLVAATPKTGRSGAMVFVTVRHEYRRGGALAVVEEQDFAYRSQRPGEARGLPVAMPDAGGPAPGGIRLVPDAAMLFRFSALTYNTHRIHYDHPYATGVEGYPGLVVHGPLLALLLLELPRRFAPGRQVSAFSYRLHRPAFAGTAVVAHGDAAGSVAAGVPGAPPAVTGVVTLG